MRAILTALALLLVTACDTAPGADGDSPGEVTASDLVEICEGARSCSLMHCSEQADLLAELLDSEPAWDEPCIDGCNADGCQDDGSCDSCHADCTTARAEAEAAWRAEYNPASVAYSQCEGACAVIESAGLATSDDCALGMWSEEPEWCAEKIGAAILEPVDCGEAVAAADF